MSRHYKSVLNKLEQGRCRSKSQEEFDWNQLYSLIISAAVSILPGVHFNNLTGVKNLKYFTFQITVFITGAVNFSESLDNSELC